MPCFISPVLGIILYPHTYISSFYWKEGYYEIKQFWTEMAANEIKQYSLTLYAPEFILGGKDSL